MRNILLAICLVPVLYSCTDKVLQTSSPSPGTSSSTIISASPGTNSSTVTTTPVPEQPSATPTPVPTPQPTLLPNLPANKGTVTTYAGLGLDGYSDGKPYNSKFSYPSGIAVDSFLNVFVADTRNNRIRKISIEGVVSTITGDTEGFSDGTASNARFKNPWNIAVDNSGNLFVTDANNVIRKISPTGAVSTFAGVPNEYGFADGSGTNAKFDGANGVAVDNSGNVFVAEASNIIRKISPEGVVSIFAGRSEPGGAVDGTASNARFNFPFGIAVEITGNIFIADKDNDRIRKISPDGVVSTLAGSTSGFADGAGTNAQFNSPYGVAVDNTGNVFVTDTYNNRIRKISSDGVVSTLAGVGTEGFVDGTGTNAQFYSPTGIAVDSSGSVYVADEGNHSIRKIQ